MTEPFIIIVVEPGPVLRIPAPRHPGILPIVSQRTSARTPDPSAKPSEIGESSADSSC